MSRQLGAILAGLFLVASFAGCTGSGSDYKTARQIDQERQAAGKPVHAGHDHDHGAGPHGGAIVELGDEEYHAEVVVDAGAHTLRVFLLGPDAKTASPIAAASVSVVTEDQKTLTLKAVPQEGDGDGKASKFELTDKEAVDAIAREGFLHGALQLEVDGKSYRGDIDAHFDGSSHDDHHDAAHPEQTKDAAGEENAPANTSEQ